MKLKGLSRVFWSMIDLVLDKWNPLGTYEHELGVSVMSFRHGKAKFPEDLKPKLLERYPAFFENQNNVCNVNNAFECFEIFDEEGVWPTMRHGSRLNAFMKKLKNGKIALPVDIAKQFHDRGLKMVKVLKEDK